MLEKGIINRGIAKLIAEQGHGDLLMVVDAGFAIPKGIEVVDLSISENVPTVLDVMCELSKFYSVEQIIIAEETKEHNPSLIEKVNKIWDNPCNTFIPHVELKAKSGSVKGVIRTGDFNSFANFILVSGCGTRWVSEY